MRRGRWEPGDPFGPRTRQFREGNIPCGYCLVEIATVWDHIIPYSHGGATKDDNLYPSCTRCNLLLSSHQFKSLEAKKAYVERKLRARGKWQTPGHLSHLQSHVSKNSTLAKILQSQVSIRRVAEEENRRSCEDEPITKRCEEIIGELRLVKERTEEILEEKRKGHFERESELYLLKDWGKQKRKELKEILKGIKSDKFFLRAVVVDLIRRC